MMFSVLDFPRSSQQFKAVQHWHQHQTLEYEIQFILDTISVFYHEMKKKIHTSKSKHRL